MDALTTKLMMEHAVRRLAGRCIDHPELEKDPVCVIATERENLLQEIARADLSEPEPLQPLTRATPVAVSHNGHRKRKIG